MRAVRIAGRPVYAGMRHDAQLRVKPLLGSRSRTPSKVLGVRDSYRERRMTFAPEAYTARYLEVPGTRALGLLQASASLH